MHKTLREFLPERFQRLSRNIKNQALSRGIIDKTDADKGPDFFASKFDNVGKIEELRDVIRCLAALRLDGEGSGGNNDPDGDCSPQFEIERPRHRQR